MSAYDCEKCGAGPGFCECKSAISTNHVKTIEWLQRSLREAGKCRDGGTCHHHCKPDPKAECFREACCAPLGGAHLNDDWTIPGVES